ncbi:MAG: PAS domain S-box protein, partial [Desulfobacterales bacterium]|nr:PAS domain S-box protein [Desulfobacterales bacterium]
RPIKFGKEKAILRVARDITERKEAERALLKEKNFSDAVMNSSPGLFFVFDDKGNTIQWNRNAEKVTGYSAQEISKMNILDFVAKEDQKTTAEAMQEVLTKGQSSLEINVLSKPGKKTSFHIIGLSTKFENTTCVVCTGIDITERKQAEDALKNSEEKYRTILENIEDGYYEVDLNGNFTFFNASTCRILGYPQEEMMGMNNRQFTDKDNAKKLFKTFNEVYRTGEPTKEFDWQIMRKDGTKRYIEVSISLRKDSSGKPIGFRGVARDITERKQAEEALRKSEQQLCLVTDHITDVVWSMDLEGNFTFVTPSSERIVGYTVEEMLSLNFSQIIAPESYKMAMDLISKHMSVEKREPMILEMEQVSKDGSKKWCEVTAIFLEDQNNRPTGIIGVTRDITERKQAQKELQRSYHKLRETLIVTVNTLASTVEMRDPYTAGHQRRVTILACAIAEEMGLTEEQFDGLRMAGLIHDIGKINVPVEILSRPGRISDTEFNIIKTHPHAGYKVLKEIEFPWPVAQIVLQHHERLDGSGYPQGLKNGGIMLEAKILAVADVVEAMASDRPYRPALGIEAALHEITMNKGILYDPDVTDICMRLFIEQGFTLGQEM